MLRVGRRGAVLLCAATLGLTACALPRSSSNARALSHLSPVSAFVDVSVVPMDLERVLEHQTVLVRGGEISEIGPAAQVRVPTNARVIDGRGRWLAPGLADMHTHIDDPADFDLLLAYGVTTTLNMGGASENYRGPIREALRSRRMIGPYPLIALKIDGPGDSGGTSLVPRTTEEARAAVRGAHANGYDYVKIYSRLQPDMFEAIMDETHRQHLPVVGHVVRSVGLERGLERGQVMIAHGEEYLTVFNDGPPDETVIPDLVRLSLAHHVTVTANVAGITRIAEQWGHPDRVAEFLADPAAERMRPALRQEWRSAVYQRLSGQYTAEAQFVQHLTSALHRAGVPIIVGTDTPDIPGIPPGASVHDEIAMLRSVGFSNYEAMAAATREAGAFVARTLPREQRFGQVVRGYRADLILLSENPLQNIDTLRHPVGVMTQGHWISL